MSVQLRTTQLEGFYKNLFKIVLKWKMLFLHRVWKKDKLLTE